MKKNEAIGWILKAVEDATEDLTKEEYDEVLFETMKALPREAVDVRPSVRKLILGASDEVRKIAEELLSLGVQAKVYDVPPARCFTDETYVPKPSETKYIVVFENVPKRFIAPLCKLLKESDRINFTPENWDDVPDEYRLLRITSP